MDPAHLVWQTLAAEQRLASDVLGTVTQYDLVTEETVSPVLLSASTVPILFTWSTPILPVQSGTNSTPLAILLLSNVMPSVPPPSCVYIYVFPLHDIQNTQIQTICLCRVA